MLGLLYLLRYTDLRSLLKNKVLGFCRGKAPLAIIEETVTRKTREN